MGRIIRLGTDQGPSHPFLTKTGQGGVLSPGYLRDDPAGEYLEDDETPVFVLTNADRGVVLGTGDDAEVVEPGPGYRTIAVVTDRQIVAVIGDSGEYSRDGDRSFSIDLRDVGAVDVEGSLRTARLQIRRSNERTLQVYAGSDGLEDVRDYLATASKAWRTVEEKLETIEEILTAATDHRRAGDHEATLETARDAYDLIKEAREVATRMNREAPGTALASRIRSVEAACVRTVARIRLDRARAFTERGERHWQNEEYERAHDAFDRAGVEYDTVLSLDDEYVEDADAVDREATRLDRMTEKLRESPLREAVEADKAATDADDPAAAADAWTDALEAYRTAMDLDWGAEQRRFAGETEDIRNRIDTVVERLIAARRKAAKQARQSADWQVGAGRTEAALVDFATAREQYEHALTVARDCYPDVTNHLTVELEALEERVGRVKATRETEDAATVESDDERDENAAVEVDAEAEHVGAGN